MRTDLRLVYSELEKVSERISSYYTAIEEVEIAVEDMRSFLEEQESEAITKLKEKLDSVTIDMADKKSMLEALRNILDDYIADMRGLVREAVSGNQTRVDTLDISYNLWQMKNAYQSLEQATAFPVSSESFWQFGDEEEEERRKRERNYQKLENFRTNQLAGLKTRMKNRLDGIDDIYKKYLKAFETMDDSYRKRLDEIYNEKTSSQDKRKNFWESFGNISKAFLKAFAVAAAGAVLLALLPAWAPLVMLGGVALVGAGCMVMAEVPKEYVPEWMSGMKDTSDGVSKKLKEYLKRPEGMIEDIGQGLMDTVQTPEGIASVSGTVSGMLLGNWAGKMIKPQVYTQVGKTKENVVKWWKSARNNVRAAGNGGRLFQIKPAPRVKNADFSNQANSIITPEMKEKILWGQRTSPTKNKIIGGHSPEINNSHPNYAVEDIMLNPDGTKKLKYITQFSDGNLSKIKTSTVFPEGWSESKILESSKSIGNGSPINVRTSDGATWHRSIVDGVEIDVIKRGNEIISAYPTGTVNGPPPVGFSK
jgi:cell division protein ZapA (FtsZ GTPase activity inhibitor)